MKLIPLKILGLALLSGSAGLAAPLELSPKSASTGGAYVGIEGGEFKLQSITPSAGPVSVNFKFKSGAAFNIPVGYDFGNGFRVGFSVGEYKSDFGSVTGYYGGQSQPAATHGTTSFIPVMATAAYSFKITERFKWFIGAGAGAVHEDLNFTGFDYPATKSIIFGQLGSSGNHPLVSYQGIKNQEWGFAFEAFTGFSYAITESVALQLGYKYLQLSDKVSINGGSGSRLQGQSVELGLTVKF